MKVNAPLAALVLALSPTLATAEVADSSSNVFTVKAAFTISATPEEVYRRLINVGDWWDSAHSFSGDARNLSIEEKPMGCL